MIQNADTAVDG